MYISDFSVNKYKSSIIFCRFLRKKFRVGTFWQGRSGNRKHTYIFFFCPNISRSKGNQTIKFGQSIEHNMRDIFLEKSSTKCGEETIPRPFSKKSKLSISLDQ